jgi:hypothetical protein
MHSCNHLEQCCNHTNATRLHFSPVYFHMEHNGSWSQTRDSRLSTAQTTVKVNRNLRSQNVYVTAASLKTDSHIACRAHAVPLPCRADKGLECVFPI